MLALLAQKALLPIDACDMWALKPTLFAVTHMHYMGDKRLREEHIYLSTTGVIQVPIMSEWYVKV